MKKVIRLTESDLTTLVKRVITEQSEERKFTMAIQKFLNSKKIYGDNNKPLVVDGRTDNNMESQTSQAIAKYQEMIRANVDGVWGENTGEKMPPNDVKMLKKIIYDQGDILDRFLNLIGF